MTPLPWRVTYDRRFGGWIVVTTTGELVARFETEDDARTVVQAINTTVRRAA